MRKILMYAISAGVLAVGGMAQAATIRVTEGNRAQVAGTDPINDVFIPGSTDGYDFGNIDTDTIEIYGRVTRAEDQYLFQFNAVSSFSISFIFGGYDLENGGSVTASGWTGDDGKEAIFSLLDGLGVELDAKTYTTDYTAGEALIFAGGPGSYGLKIDGQGRTEGLYDIRLLGLTATSEPQPVPLPATGLLLMGGVAGLGALRRRRRA